MQRRATWCSFRGMKAINKFRSRGLTHAQIAKSLGISRAAVTHYASDKRFPSEDTVRGMVRLATELRLDLTAEDLLPEKQAA